MVAEDECQDFAPVVLILRRRVGLQETCEPVGRLHVFEADADEEGHSWGRLIRRGEGVDALFGPSRDRLAAIAVFWHFYGGLTRIGVSETATKARKASKTPGENPQPVRDPRERMANPTD
ncbi:hypothetical protein GQ600_24156 [Phytophthora cactorum]|nr:hypothetical protein GQ600_24156 [Phytophthora cactorum]